MERGRLWLLQTRVGKRTAAAAFRIATQLVDEGLITLDEALQRVSGAQLAQLTFPQFDPGAASYAPRQGHGRLSGRSGGPGRLRPGDGGRLGGAGSLGSLVRGSSRCGRGT